MTTTDETQLIETMCYLRDCGYSKRHAAKAMGIQRNTLYRLAAKHNVSFPGGASRAKPKQQESPCVYQLGLSEREWKQIEKEVRHWFDVLGETTAARNRAASMWGIPVGAIHAYERGDYFRIG